MKNSRTHPDDGICEHAGGVAKSDSVDLDPAGVFIYVGVSGDLKVTTIGGEDATFVAAPVGFLPVRVKRVWSTGTNATSLLACW